MVMALMTMMIMLMVVNSDEDADDGADCGGSGDDDDSDNDTDMMMMSMLMIIYYVHTMYLLCFFDSEYGFDSAYSVTMCIDDNEACALTTESVKMLSSLHAKLKIQ